MNWRELARTDSYSAIVSSTRTLQPSAAHSHRKATTSDGVAGQRAGLDPLVDRAEQCLVLTQALACCTHESTRPTA